MGGRKWTMGRICGKKVYRGDVVTDRAKVLSHGDQARRLHSLGGSTFVFHYYSLGGDTAILGGLYAGLCHAFLVYKNADKYYYPMSRCLLLAISPSVSHFTLNDVIAAIPGFPAC